MNDMKFALQMEHDGERYYREQASLIKNKGIRSVCLLLADEEKHHGELLEKKFGSKLGTLSDTDALAQAKNVFHGLSAIKVDGVEKASQLDFYRIASEKEKESIELYTKYLAHAKSDEEKQLFEFLIRQETHHYEILEAFVAFVKRPEDWVENAEFGIREDY
ncbi:MAG: ferritin family protein [Firmicutes bacterium]|nr:ferritin family protein [Bacillota bacterium]